LIVELEKELENVMLPHF